MEFKYSIIIPHKNSPALLSRCLDSIPDRDDLQIVIIDDNSDDSVVDFSNFPGVGRRNTFVIFSKDSRGAGYARNLGLAKANSKWLLFADADDYYVDLNELLDKYANVEDVDIVYYNCKGETQDSNRCTIYNAIIDRYLSGDPMGEKQIKFNWWTPWNKLINRKLVDAHKLQFEEVMSGNDAKFCLLAGYFAKKIEVTSNYYYISTIQKSSITLRKKTIEERLEALTRMIRIWKFTKAVGAPNKTYKNNIISKSIIIDLVRQYGLRDAFVYVLRYIKDSLTIGIYKELNEAKSV